jgi:hypothetical protein
MCSSTPVLHQPGHGIPVRLLQILKGLPVTVEAFGPQEMVLKYLSLLVN